VHLLERLHLEALEDRCGRWISCYSWRVPVLDGLEVLEEDCQELVIVLGHLHCCKGFVIFPGGVPN